MRFKLFGGFKHLKAGLLSHKFACQPNHISNSAVLDRPAYEEINRKRDIENILSEYEVQKESKHSDTNKFSNVQNINEIAIAAKNDGSTMNQNIENELEGKTLDQNIEHKLDTEPE